MRIALVSRELHPYAGGGIAPIVAAAARLLSEIAEVTLVTTDGHREAHERLRAEGDPRLPPEAVRLVWVPEPGEGEAAGYFSHMHAYSARAYEALRAAYPDGGPDVIEFCDYLGEGFVTVQARRTLDPWLERTLVCARLHTTSEIVSVLDGNSPTDFATAAVHDAERYVLRHADRILWSGGDVLGTYERFYGAGALAPAELIRDAFLSGDAGADPAPRAGGPLELLYLGRAERRKGVQNLVRAMTIVGRTDVRLSLLGGDTSSGPLQTSLRAQLELMAAGDERIRFQEHVSPSEVARHIAVAHAVVMPSLWECWPNVAREALMHNRPVLATPVGGLCDMVVPGRSGWLVRDSSPQAIADGIERLADDREAIGELIASGGPRARFEELVDRDEFLAGYRALAAATPARPPRRAAGSAEPLVTVVLPYHRLDATIGETLESVFAQTHPRIEVLVVNDGSLREQDAFLYELADAGRISVVSQVNAGLSAARNTGARQARGRYVLPLDADDMIDPAFVARCVDVLERDPSLAYATTWVRYLEHDGTPMEGANGYMPYGNWSRLLEKNNVAGTCAAVFRRRVFELGFSYSPDLTSYEDWLLYLELARAGHLGEVIPERLFHYRVRPRSMMRQDGSPRTELIVGEIAAHLRENEVRWVSNGH